MDKNIDEKNYIFFLSKDVIKRQCLVTKTNNYLFMMNVKCLQTTLY